MQNSELRKKTLSGMIWKAAENFGAQAISFIISMVLARLLMPEEYGVIAIVTVIISMCDVFVNSGLGTALIQKKDADEIDFSTVFFFSFGMAVVIYVVLFISAPFIANFYENDILNPVIRVMALRIVIASFNTIQHSYVAKHMLFKKFFFSTIGGTIVSAIVGIAMALNGYGVWALVGQYLVNSIVNTIVLFFTVEWKPRFVYSWRRWKVLFTYSWKLLVASLVDTFYNNLRNLIIGKKYTADDLAYYNKGKQFPDLISTNILTTIDNVLFSAIAHKQDDKETVKSMVRRFIKTGSYLIMPMMVGLALTSRVFVKLLLTEKWLLCVPYIQIYCIVGILQPLQTANQQAIKAMGRSDITLRLEIIKKTFGVSLLLCVMKKGVFAIAASNIVYSFVVLLLNTYPNIKILGYSLWEQLKDILDNVLITGIMGTIVYFVGQLAINDFLLLMLQVIAGIVSYGILSLVTKNSSYSYLIEILKNRRK